MTRLTAVLPSTGRGWMLLVSLLGLAIGFALAWPPLGLIVPSGLLFAVALLSPPETPEGEA